VHVPVFLVLQAIHELLRNGRTATQRDLYYKLQRPPVVASAKDIDAAIQVWWP
jgi:DNA topoisomerase VI subunit A